MKPLMKCPKCKASRKHQVAVPDETNPVRVYRCQKCGDVYHPPGCKCGECPLPKATMPRRRTHRRDVARRSRPWRGRSVQKRRRNRRCVRRRRR